MRARSSGQSPLLLLDVIDVLNASQIPYAVIGAMAVSCYGVVRSSLDADAILFIDRARANVSALKSSLTRARLNVVLRKADREDPLLGMILIEDRYGNRVDLVLGIRGLDKDAYKRVQKILFQDASINVIGIEDLIAMKVFAGGRKDLADAEGILAVSGDAVDRKQLTKLVKQFGPSAVKNFRKISL